LGAPLIRSGTPLSKGLRGVFLASERVQPFLRFGTDRGGHGNDARDVGSSIGVKRREIACGARTRGEHKRHQQKNEIDAATRQNGFALAHVFLQRSEYR
jgi:hypothetical protein